MKKLMIAFVAVAVAAVTQAATIQWGGAIANTGITEMSAGSIAWLIRSSSAFTGEATTLDTAAGTANNGGAIVSTYEITASDIYKYTFTSTYTVSGEGVDGYYAILVADGSDLTKASYMNMGPVSGTSAMSAPTDLLYNIEWNDDTAYLSSGGFTTSVVPEPTSGLLMLLGIAGLALKRKRA